MIIKTPVTTNYFSAPNHIAQDNTLSDRAARIVTYAASLPANWRIIPAQLMKHFGWGRDSTYRALRELCVRGYAILKRGKQFAEWIIYTTPQTPESLKATPDAASKNPDFKNPCQTDALQSNKDLQITENYNNPPTVPEPIPATEKPSVVVQDERFEQQTPTACDPVPTVIDDTQQAIPGIPDQHQPTARHALRTLTKEEADSVLCAFTLAMSKGGIQNPIGYLVSLTKAALDGSFAPVSGSGATPAMTAGERIRREKVKQEEAQARGRMSNDEYMAWLERTYGDKQQVAQSKTTGGKVSLRQALGW